MLDRQTVVQYLRSLSQDEIAGLLLAANVIPHGDGAQQTASERIPCPHCGSHNIFFMGLNAESSAVCASPVGKPMCQPREPTVHVTLWDGRVAGSLKADIGGRFPESC